jgi:exopolyphosphatase/guanosine-5'-triphosphate,3'-diphosphate pyrophosphatase
MIKNKPIRMASVDIGSNAIRLFVGQKLKSGRVKVLEDKRASVRLGKDVFALGRIRAVTRDELARALKKFRRTCDELGVSKIKAVGTSALRDSKNGRQVINHLKTRTGIKVDVINGHREALLLHRAVSESFDLRNKTSMLMDMGGGSLEVVLSHRGRIRFKESLPLGTVRLLAKVGVKGSYEDFAARVRTPIYLLRGHMFDARIQPVDLLVGTGGNLRSLGKLAYRLGLSRSRNRFTRHGLEVLTQKLFRLNLETRMKRFQMRKDRADVILPAAVVTLELMRIFDIKSIVVPNVGIKNGLFFESTDRV